ncbi:nuclear transport factor 2 family protein [Ottowia thiooxydans]|uniref:nuclear transport factor 2 family protein n=1 Tax=Ottowia thiooxydans TaxID=219182 RepID=UPI000406CAF5|nr:nuclear transport factor 2 family protein [Ottowia thiooxydans]
MSIEAFQGCAQTISRFYALLDGIDSGSVGAMFAADGVWHRQGAELRGPDAVNAALAQRPVGRRSAHLISNLHFDAGEESQIKARYLLQVFRHDADSENALAAASPMEGSMLAITSVQDLLQRGNNGEWVLLKKQSSTLFSRSSA